MKTWLVAHRGARKEEQENTIAAFKAAAKYPISMIELDVRVTKDDIAVVHHDKSIKGRDISAYSYAELLIIDPNLASFESVTKKFDSVTLFVELKSPGSSKHALHYLTKNHKALATSFLLDELVELQHDGIDNNRLFLAQHHPFGLLRKARINSIGGITASKWYFNPILYNNTKKLGLNTFIYTVNSAALCKILRKVAPSALICTDRPDKLQRVS